jgi:hypothetical protein
MPFLIKTKPYLLELTLPDQSTKMILRHGDTGSPQDHDVFNTIPLGRRWGGVLIRDLKAKAAPSPQLIYDQSVGLARD